MTSWTEILKANKGLHARDSFSELWGLKLKAARAEFPDYTITGTLPLTFNSRAAVALKNYRIYGTSEGTGVATESGEPAGFKIPILNTSGVTENLWDGVIVYGEGLTDPPHSDPEQDHESFAPSSSTSHSDKIAVLPDKVYTIKFQTPTTLTRSIYAYDSSGTFLRVMPQQIMSNTIYWTFRTLSNQYYIIFPFNIDDTQLMLVEGSTIPDHYIPHRYESNYDLFIGSTKLLADEYVDYGEQKVYKLKEAHKDTVTIDGVVWDILGYDHDEVYDGQGNLAQRSVTIQTHDCISELQFDAREALFAFPEGLAAGTYHFTVSQQPWYAGDVGKTMQFTLTSDIPADGVIVLGNAYNATMIGSTISVYASCSATTATETATISEGNDGTDLGSVGNAISGNTNSIQRALLGSNNYNESAIRQYLNSDGTAGTYWTPQNKWDRPPSWNASTAGFLRGFNSDFISAIGKVSKRTTKNTVSDGGGYIDTEEKVFLLSRTEVYAGTNNSISEGTAYKYYSDYSDLSSAGTGADSNRTKYRNNVAKYWWLRSPGTSYASYPLSVSPSGTVSGSLATNSYGVAPACCIVLDDINTNPYLQSLFLKPTDPPVPLPPIPTYKGENTLSSTETLGEVSITGKITEMA